MKLSEHTISVLKNFASINQNLVIREGSELQTMSAMKNIVARSGVEENFPKEVAIYDLNEFLAALSLFSSPILEFDDQYIGNFTSSVGTSLDNKYDFEVGSFIPYFDFEYYADMSPSSQQRFSYTSNGQSYTLKKVLYGKL